MKGYSEITRIVSFRMPNERKRELDEFCSKTGFTKTELFHRWIEAGFESEKARISSIHKELIAAR